MTTQGEPIFTGNPRGLLSLDSAKAIKAQGYGYLNAILYVAPASLGSSATRTFNLCPNASTGCLAACLGWHSGQAEMVSAGQTMNPARRSREQKAQAFMWDRARFVRLVACQIASADQKARKLGLSLCVRLNGSADIPWEGIGVDVDAATARTLARHGRPCTVGRHASLMAVFPHLQFVDYTKNAHRIRKQLRGNWPINYWLTFSRSEANESEARELLALGANVAAVFGDGLPSTWSGYRVINGDLHDLRHLDPRGGVVVGLSPKGRKAKRDRTSGFVVWADPAQPMPAIVRDAPLALAA